MLFQTVVISLFYLLALDVVTTHGSLEITRQKNVEVQEGERLRLHCGNKRKQIIWYKDDLRIENNDSRLKKRGKIFKVKKATTTDAGRYHCAPYGNKRWRVFNVKVVQGNATSQLKFAEQKSTNKREIIAMEGRSIQHSCRASGSRNIDYKWYKNGKLRPRKQYESKDELILSRLTISDSGLYKCVVSDGHSQIQDEFELIVQEKVRTRPYIDKSHFKDQSLKSGENVTLKCIDLIGGSTTRFYWLKWKQQPNMGKLNEIIEKNELDNGENLYELLGENLQGNEYEGHRSHRSSPKQYGVEFDLQNLSAQDSAYYSCLAMNVIGNDFASMNIQVP